MLLGRPIFLAVLLSSLPVTAVVADPPPIKAYAALPAAQDPRLSPDGDMLAMIAPMDDRAVLVVRAIDEAKKVKVLTTGETLPDWFHWKTSNRLLASVRFTANRVPGAPNGETRLVFINADGSNATVPKVTKDLPSGNIVVYGNIGNRIPQFQDRVINLLPDDPDHLLMAVTPLTDYIHPQVVKVDVNSGRPAVVQGVSGDVINWMTDGTGMVRVGIEIKRAHFGDSETRRAVVIRNTPDENWQVIDESDVNGGHRFFPAGFAKDDPNILYVLTDDASGRLVARKFDMTSRALGDIVAGASDCDVDAMERDHQLLGFRLPCHNAEQHYLDPDWQKDWEALRKYLKTDFVTLIDRTPDGQRTMAAVHRSIAAPVSFWLLDRRQKPANLRELGGAYEAIPDDQLAVPRWISYRARDGLPISAILTLPVGTPEPGREGAKPIPFVLLPHGGPSSHDRLQFDWMVQFLISRGYGVLQPQFRGSTGYGLPFQEAGYQQWGGAMQDDLTDGTHWLIDQGWADPAHIAIVGASYGGYAALMGVIKEPKLYACAAAFAPVTDLNRLVGDLHNFAFKDVNIPRIKGAGQDLDVTSPVENADKIEVPILLMHGRKDFTVPVEHSEEMERALKRAKKPVEAVYLEKADHYFAAGSDRLAWLSGLDRLLAANLRVSAAR